MATSPNDVFTKWIVGIAGTAVVAIGGILLSSITELKQDMAIVKENTKQTTTTVIDHEQRIRGIESEARQDNNRTRTWDNYSTWRRRDTSARRGY